MGGTPHDQADRESDHERMLLTEFSDHASLAIDSPADAVFEAISAVDHLPEWNKQISSVIAAPDGQLRVGTEWIVQMSLPPAKWPSRSTVIRIDHEHRYFEYRSQSDDGNPSYVLWQWRATASPDGTHVDVTWTVFPKTFWRRLIFARLRRRQLRNEVPASLHELNAHVVTIRAGEGTDRDSIVAPPPLRAAE